ncbi:urease accessory protein UreF [Corynebacterium halotolerans]|uniref:Urease accessory protein UreF n=1 Tax=Corynebacterium halotolerans YIM 70093 = DSM 44683 TaxID=1121362 RepID=M1MZ26_9CORY|nr:urease accessory protein UreF [Corynebacterium halotolerans]AGF72949.1 urease accessory protein UreF [Corynebacterium halotolerans YIM 70093 = DSM 44683]
MTTTAAEKTFHLTSVLAAMQLTDSAIPTGAFSHSLGFETYLDDGRIHDEESFREWIGMFINQQLTFTDALAIRLIYHAEDFDEIVAVDNLTTAQALPRQVRQAGITMGKRLLTIGTESFPGPWQKRYRTAVDEGEMHAHQACVWAVLARSTGLDEDTAVAQHLLATAISLTQNAVRAVPLGQNAGQRVIRHAHDTVLQAVEHSRSLSLDDLGAIAPGLEIAQMRHERQRSRMFMS